MRLIIVFVVTGVCTFSSFTQADVKLPAIFSDHMVLQQKTKVMIWGWAEPGEKITVKGDWAWGKKTTKADENSHWKLMIKTPKAGKTGTLRVKGDNEVVLDDILFGEVWICSGQSNMEMPLTNVSLTYSGIIDFEAEIANAKYPDIRLFQVGNYSSKEPLDDVQSGISIYGVPPAPCTWQRCTPETIPTFSSTAYFFARELHQKLGIPVGVIDSSWGGTSAEVWTLTSGLEKLGYQDQLGKAANSPQKADNKEIPTRLYNGMIYPLHNFRIKGVIWYQGESNAVRAGKYCALFSTMIEHWREDFGYAFPFYFVQISPFFNHVKNLNTAYLREAQLETMLSVPKTGMAVTLDIGNQTDVHPKNKQEVGRRLALWALADTYGKKDVIPSGPIYQAMAVEGRNIRISFDYVDGGLVAKDDRLLNFEIAGADRQFVPAAAVIDGDTVVVSNNGVEKPVAVRYGWSNWVEGSLFNKAGLPASSFRTDDWPLESKQISNSNK